MSTDTTTDISTYFRVNSEGMVSGYGLMKGTSAALKDLGIDKELPGPMGYTYLKKGYVTGSKGVKACTVAEAAEWASKYIDKLVGKVTPEVDDTPESEIEEDVEVTVISE